METATEVAAQEGALRMRRVRYEKLLGDKVRLEGSLVRTDALDYRVGTLKEMLVLVDAVPPALVTKGGRFVSGGFLVQEMLRVVVMDALVEVQRLDAQRLTDLAQLRSALERIDADIALVTQED